MNTVTLPTSWAFRNASRVYLVSTREGNLQASSFLHHRHGPPTSQQHRRAGHSQLVSSRIRASPVFAAAPEVAGPSKVVQVAIPQSQLAAVQDAVTAVKLQLQGSKGMKGKQAKKAGLSASAEIPANRFAMEIPTADTSAQGDAELAGAVLSSLSRQPDPIAPGSLTAVFASSSSAAAATTAASLKSVGCRVLDLSAACRLERLGGVVVLVSPQTSDVALVEQLLDEVWTGPAVVLLNAEWAAAGSTVPPAFRTLVDSFAVVYSFLPISVKGLVGNKEGAVLRRVTTAGSAAVTTTPWCILYETRGQFSQVGQTKARPKAEDLELAFSYASAATSPLTGVVKFLKSAADSITGKKK